jgi:hypothetical protein
MSAEHGEVGRRIASDDNRRRASSIDERDAHGLRTLNDVLVREHIPIGRDDDAGAGATARALRVISIPADVHADDRGTDLIDGTDDRARVRVERFDARCVDTRGIDACARDTGRLGR